MNVDFIRRVCLSLPEAKENLQWGETLCFKVRGKIFATLSLDSVPQRISLKADPAKFADLLEHEDIVPAPYVGRYKWIMLKRLDAVPRHEVDELIRTSYELVSSKIKKVRKQSHPKTRR